MTFQKTSLRLAVLVLANCAPMSGAKSPSAHVLPLRHVRLFESGVGYFERSGELQPGDATGLPVPASHLDDALKTLVILGADSKVDGLTFATTESFSLARARVGLPTDPAADITFVDMLKALRGEVVHVVGKTESFDATVIDVESDAPSPPTPQAVPPTVDSSALAAPKPAPQVAHRLVLYTTQNQVVRVPFEQLVSVAPVSPIIAARILAALQPGGNQAANAQKMLSLLGETKGKVAFGYVSEVPIWRTSYRAVLGKDKSVLQAWALIHNDTDEAWQGVQVQLANGRPDSFLFPLATPRYGRRPMITPPDKMSSLPQLLSQTPDDMAGEETGGLSLTGHGEGGGGYGQGYGSGGGSISGYGRGSGLEYDERGAVGFGLTAPNLAPTADSTSEESANLFIYTLQNRLDVAAHSSALVPFLARDIDLDRVTYFASTNATPVTAVHFTNNTPQTLPAGTISFFDAGGFVGESTLDRMGPNAKAYVSFGTDLDVTLKDDLNAKTTDKEIHAHDGWLYLHSVRTTKHHATLKNTASDDRKVAIAFPGLQPKATFTPSTGVDMIAPPTMSIAVPAHQDVTTDFAIDENMVSGMTFSVKALTPYLTMDSIPAAQRAVLNEIVDKAKVAEKTKLTITELDQKMRDADMELKRLREHLKALGDKNVNDAHAVMTRILQAEDALKDSQKARDSLRKLLDDQWAECRKPAEKLPEE